MSPAPPRQSRQLVAWPIPVSSSEFREIQGWNYPDEPFYVRQVRRMLLTDLPQLILFQNCLMLGFADPAVGPVREPVGFGTIMVSDVHAEFAGGLPHCYIPLLSVKPGIKSYGYGESIVRFLVAEAAVWYRRWPAGGLSSRVFLDVYTANTKAFELYRDRCEFETLNPSAPIPDGEEGNEPFHVMARDISTGPPQPPATN